ncbi:MAG: hypothetical protein Q7W44_09425 [Coriobacteriia bacterium]|nr:hypothetical protein [Coriobacteriia bacterium]
MRPRPGLPSLLPRMALAAALIVALAALPACNGAAADKRDVTDSSSLFHFKIPATWQYMIEPSVVSVYAADTLPETGQPAEALAIVTHVSSATTDTPVAEALVAYAGYLSQTRGWTDVEIGEPADVLVGGRTASAIDIAGADGNGRAFRARYVWVRTNSREVLVTAIAPPGAWGEYSDDLDTLLDEWYWHRAEGTSADTTATP